MHDLAMRCMVSSGLYALNDGIPALWKAKSFGETVFILSKVRTPSR